MQGVLPNWQINETNIWSHWQDRNRRYITFKNRCDQKAEWLCYNSNYILQFMPLSNIHRFQERWGDFAWKGILQGRGLQLHIKYVVVLGKLIWRPKWLDFQDWAAGIKYLIHPNFEKTGRDKMQQAISQRSLLSYCRIQGLPPLFYI